VLVSSLCSNPTIRRCKYRTTLFAQTLQELGWAVGRNLIIDTRSVGGDTDRLRRVAAELVALAPDVIHSVGGVPLAPLQQATRTIPIVFMNVPDPVGARLRPKHGAPGRQYHWLLEFRVQHER
jgi:putative tryptophan/tyrosine transport system substrate-binding protein